MRYTIILLALLLCCSSAFSQSGYTTVTAQVIDPLGTFYANCTGSASFVPSPFATQPPTLGGSVFQTDVPISGCDSFGNFTLILADNNIVQDGHPQGLQGSQWRISICNKGGTPCKATVLTITGATQNITTAIQPMPTISNPAGGGSLTRLTMTGTALTSSDFSISGWGTGSSITSVSGTDSGFQVTVTSGTSACGLGCATVTLTFHDGPWNSIQGMSAQRFSGSGTYTDISVANTLSSITLTFLGLVLPSQTYTFGVIISGQSSVVHGTPVINPVLQNPAGPQTINGNLTLVGPVNVTGNLAASADGSFSGNYNHSGTELFTGPFTSTNPCAIDGVLYVSQSGCYSTFSAALSQCKSQGSCIIDARGASNVLNIGTFDPNINSTSSAEVTLLLGPYTYQVTQIVLRSNLQVIGSGPTVPSGDLGTNLVQASAGTAPIALPTSGAAVVTIAQGVHLSNFNLTPAASSSTDGISIVAAGCGTGCSGGGLWYSSLDHIFVEPGFGRNAIRIDGTNCDKCSAMQFASFRDVWAFRNANALPVLLITGAYIGQATFDACQFDVAFSQTDTNANLVNIQIDDTPTSLVTCPNNQCWVPYSIKFQNTTIQFAKATGGVGLLVKGAQNVSCDNCHFEQDSTIASFVLGPGGHGSWGSVIMNSYIDGFAGTGGLINIDGNSSLFFHNNTEGANPPSGGFLTVGSTPTFLDWGGNMNSIGGANFSPLPEPTLTISQLPPVGEAVGVKRMVSDSTAIASEGQVCTHASSSPVTAIAISNGSNWKCF